MDLSSSLRRKQTTVTYGKRNRAANSAHSSPAAARPSLTTTSSSRSSDDEAAPSDTLDRGANVVDASLSSQTSRTSRASPSHSSSRHPAADNIKANSRTNINGVSRKPSSSTSSALLSASLSRSALTSTPLSASGSSSAKFSPTKPLPQRPARAASPSATKSDRRASTSTLPAKRSASTSPRKQASVSPSKRAARSRTPSRPAQDLASLFDAIEPSLPQPRNPFARSESQPVVRLNHDDAEDSLAPSAAFPDSPLASPALPAIGLDDGQPLSPGTLTSPSKRPRMADRMAPRAARSTKSKVDQIADALLNARKGSLRRTETAPSAISEAGSAGPFASDAERPDSLKIREDESKSARHSDAGSAWIDTASQADSQSQEGTGSAVGARRLAGIKQASATNAKRTYGLQRSFLADQAEENLLTESAPPSTSITASRNIEDEIEAELRGNGIPKAPVEPHLPETAPAPQRESYAELLKKWGEGADDIEWDESQDPTLNLKSITSLRSQGELRRFNDDLEYLFAGLEPSQSLSIRRSSAVELVRLLCGKPDMGSLDDDQDDGEDDTEDPIASAQSADFLRKLKASDLIARLFDLFRGAEAGEGIDDVLDAALAVYVAKLLKAASSADVLTRERWSELYATLHELLVRADRTQRQERKDGLALLRLHELKQHKIASRSDRKAFDELRAIARISKLFVSGARSWTLRNLVLAACCSLIALPRRLLSEAAINDLLVASGDTVDRPRPSLFTTVLNVMISEGGKAHQRLIDFAKGLELVSPAAVESIPDLETVDVCIRFLDKGMDLLYLELDQAVPASSETLDALQHLTSFAIQAARFGTQPSADDAETGRTGASPTRALQVLHGLFKTMLDLSQVDANWSETLATSQPLQASILRAFLLSHQSAVHLGRSAATANGSKRGSARTREDLGQEANDGSPAVALFDDVVHLSLALLTNLLIKQLDKARDTLQSVQLEPTCWGRRSCALACECESQLPALQLLARVFFETRIAAASDDDSNAAYLSNSIATALAQFAVGGPARLASCRAALDAELPRSHSKKNGGVKVIKQDGFATLLDAVEEFAVVHEAALNAERIRAAQVGPDSQEGEEVDVVPQETEADSSNPVAVEAGQLIKDLALALRQMA